MGENKVQIAKQRIHDINPDCNITCLDMFVDSQTQSRIFEFNPDYIIDCIDTVTSKIALVMECKHRDIKLICCLGTGNRLNPNSFVVGDITQTAGSGCGLARVLRRELKARGVLSQKVLFSTEIPQKTIVGEKHGRHYPASSAFCPTVAGYILASEVVRDLCGY